MFLYRLFVHFFPRSSSARKDCLKEKHQANVLSDLKFMNVIVVQTSDHLYFDGIINWASGRWVQLTVALYERESPGWEATPGY